MHLSKKAQIAHLKANKAPSKFSSEYANFVDVFLPKLIIELSEYTKINNHTIKLMDNWQLSYDLIYSLSFVELEILKTYIKNILANNFIRPFKFPTRAPIFFNKKPNKSLKLCINYLGLNNLIIKNQYPLPLVGKSLD